MELKGLQEFSYEKYEQEGNIFINDTILDKGYKPIKIGEIQHRETEIDIYMRHLSSAMKNIVPGNVFIYGKTGIGKTMVTKVLTAELETAVAKKGFGLKTIYIHCKSAPTNVGLLKIINEALAIETKEENVKYNNSFSAYWRNFIRLARVYKGIIIVVLDEIDALKDPDIIDLFCRVKECDFLENNVCVIGITNDIKFDEGLDPRTQSVLCGRVIVFPPYNANQLRDILTQRALLAFRPGVLSDTVIAVCAAYAAQEHGDARKALELLRISGAIAEEKKNAQVTENHVILAKERMEADKVTELIKTLPIQSKIILASCILMQNNKPQTGRIYNQYKEICIKIEITMLTQRRVTDLLSELSMLGLINAKAISLGRHGCTKEVSIEVTPETAWNIIIEDDRLTILRNNPLANPRQQILYDVSNEGQEENIQKSYLRQSN